MATRATASASASNDASITSEERAGMVTAREVPGANPGPCLRETRAFPLRTTPEPGVGTGQRHNQRHVHLIREEVDEVRRLLVGPDVGEGNQDHAGVRQPRSRRV